MPTNTQRNPGNHDDWSFNWLKLPMLLIFNIKIINFKMFKSSLPIFKCQLIKFTTTI